MYVPQQTYPTLLRSRATVKHSYSGKRKIILKSDISVCVCVCGGGGGSIGSIRVLYVDLYLDVGIFTV
jgi:hypothetical protein